MLQGQGIERLLVKTKKGHLEEVDGDCYRYFLLAGKYLEKYERKHLVFCFFKGQPIHIQMTLSTQWDECLGSY